MAAHKRFVEHMKRSEKTFAEHAIEQRLDQGLFRSWRCKKPGTWSYGFDVTTTPGNLIVTGDLGVMVFEREADMLGWLRKSINDPHYMAGNVQRDIKVREYCPEVAKEAIRECGRRIKPDDYPSIYLVPGPAGRMTYSQVKERFLETLGSQSDLDIYDEHGTKTAMYHSGFWDGGDFPTLEDYTSGYLWIYSALKWFVSKVAEPTHAP